MVRSPLMKRSSSPAGEMPSLAYVVAKQVRFYMQSSGFLMCKSSRTFTDVVMTNNLEERLKKHFQFIAFLSPAEE